MHQPPAMVLAGGLATRLGGTDKCLLDLGGRPILQQIIDRLAMQCGPIALNANGDPARFAGFGLPVLPDTLSGFRGPLAGILAAMEWASGLGEEAVLSVAGDSPLFPTDLAARLSVQARGGLALAASRDEQGQLVHHPTFGLWPTALQGDLRQFLLAGERRVRGFAQAHSAAVAIWDSSLVDPFFNINTPDDLARAQNLAL